MVVWVPCLLAPFLSGPPAEGAEIGAWKKDQADESYVVDAGRGKWLEMDATGRTFSFEELSRDEDEVELIDRGRNIKLRLKPGAGEISIGGNPYGPWVEGEWVERDTLPEFAQIAPIDHKVRLIYFIAADRQPTNNYREKIVTLMTFANSMFQYEMGRRGISKRGLVFQTDDNGVPIVHVVRGKHPAQYYNGAPNYNDQKQLQKVVPEIPRKIGKEEEQLLIVFLETYDPQPANVEWAGGIALGGTHSADGGLGTFSAWVLQDMFCATNVPDQIRMFQDRTPIPGRKAMGHGQMNSPRSEFIEDGFGAVIHEVGHALGLYHDLRDADHYIMGGGFRRLNVNLSRSTPAHRRVRFSDANALFLANSRLLNPNVDITDNSPPKVEVNIKPSRRPFVYHVQVKATDDKGLKGVIFFDDHLSSVADGGELKGKEDTVEILLPLKPNEAKKSVRVNVKVIDQGGNIVDTVKEVPAF
ncbi:hypothetical protein [Blastopirellula marina]|uniref:Uncharacterized protein n=1 Tax=Blastopirellula marina TaxID=124 RepID=A0A2S8GMH3_9BACT|nr:hypothetical protein [Blastopirellula marina]PQO45633.1 hypothetical protein C5Y93_14450 [Blastopirellula marina]